MDNPEVFKFFPIPIFKYSFEKFREFNSDLSNSNKPVGIEELQKMVWSYQSDIETHTVETHIYRLRKKILNTFNDNEFIISKKNGYQIK